MALLETRRIAQHVFPATSWLLFPFPLHRRKAYMLTSVGLVQGVQIPSKITWNHHKRRPQPANTRNRRARSMAATEAHEENVVERASLRGGTRAFLPSFLPSPVAAMWVTDSLTYSLTHSGVSYVSDSSLARFLSFFLYFFFFLFISILRSITVCLSASVCLCLCIYKVYTEIVAFFPNTTKYP